MLIKISDEQKEFGIDAYELFSYALPIFLELLLNVCTMTIKLFIILVCITTTCIDLFIKNLVASVMYVIEFSLGVLQMLVQESQDLFTLAEAILIMMWQTSLNQHCNKGYSSLYMHS